MLRFVLAACAALAPAAASADFLAENRLIVVPGPGSTFSVPFRGESGASAFWCAAGDYVIRGLNLPRGTRIYRTSEPPRRSGEGIAFSLAPAGAASSTGLATFGTTNSLSASHAQFLCESNGIGIGIFDD